MTHSVKSTFERHVNVQIDRNFIKHILYFLNKFMHKNEDHINFFGGNLIGVYSVKWIKDDELQWMEDVLHIEDLEELRYDIRDLPYINEDFNVSSDIINLSFLWVVHMGLIATHLTNEEKLRLAHTALSIMQCKFISSVHTHNFKWKADMGIALHVYENLTQKSLIKQEGSWAKLIERRSNDFLDKDGIFYHELVAFDDDENIVKILNDFWNRTKSVVQLLTSEYHDALNSKSRVDTTNIFTTIDDKELLKNTTSQYNQAVIYMNDIIPDRNAFVKENIIDVIIKISATINKHYLETTLFYYSQNYKTKKHDVFKSILEDLLMYVFDYIKKEKLSVKNIPVLALKLNSNFRSSRNSSVLFISLKQRVTDVIEDANPRIDTSEMVSARIGVFLYLTLRALIVNDK